MKVNNLPTKWKSPDRNNSFLHMRAFMSQKWYKFTIKHAKLDFTMDSQVRRD